MVSNHYTLTINQDGATWTYQNIFINDTVDTIDMPRTVIVSNKSDFNMIFRIMNENEGDGVGYTGIFLKSGSQIQMKDVGLSYRIGVKLEAAQGAAQEAVVSAFHYTTVWK